MSSSDFGSSCASKSAAHDANEGAVHDVIVCGAGPAGLAAAVGLATVGLDVAVCGFLPRDTADLPDLRTAALFAPAIRWLDAAGVWSHLAPACQELAGIRLIDDTGSVFRAPETTFLARDAGLERLGYNCPNPAIIAALLARVSELGNVTTYLGRPIVAVEGPGDGDGWAAVTLGPGTSYSGASPGASQAPVKLRAALVVAADGRRSLAREAAGLDVRRWDCRQTALTAQFRHSRPHDGISTEFHRPGGPFTVVPMPGKASALVWLDRPGAVDRLMSLGDDAFRGALEERLCGLLGDVKDVSRRGTFPLVGLVARDFAARRIALVGETAHAFPPIGAQGLNLSLRDVATLCEAVAGAGRNGGDIGADATLESYARRRRIDVTSRAYGVELLGASLTSLVLPSWLLRGPLLHTVNAVPGLKSRLILAGLGEPYAALPGPDVTVSQVA